MVSLRAADSRALSNPQNFFQLINLQASRTERLALNQSLVGNLTMQASRSGSKGVSTPFIGSSSADLTYSHERLFKVKNLSFYSTLKIQSKDIVLSKNAASQQDSTTQDRGTMRRGPAPGNPGSQFPTPHLHRVCQARGHAVYSIAAGVMTD